MKFFPCSRCGKYVDDGCISLKLCFDCLDKLAPSEDDDLPDPKEHGYFTHDDFITERI